MPINYLAELQGALKDLDVKPIIQAAAVIREAREQDKTVYIFGNGGSASTAEHFACDLLKWASVRAVSLTALPLLTAYANDDGYDVCFASQLDKMMKTDDVAIGISCSGWSMNVIEALNIAKKRGKTIMITSEESPIYQAHDISIRVPGDDIRIQEDLHLTVCHAIAGAVR